MGYGMGQTGIMPSATGINPTTFNTGAVNAGSMREKIPSGYKKGMMQQFTPEQMQLFQQMFGQVGPESYLSKLAGGDQSMFGEIEAPALRQFSALQGNLASRFSGMGGLGARKSSGFQNTMNSAASNFAQELQSNRKNLQRQAIMDLMGLSNQLLEQRPYENFMIKKQQSPWAGILGKLAGAVPGALAGFMSGGPAGAAMGSGSSVMSDSGYNALPGLEDQFRTGQAY